jgi:hypothetical protein
LSSISDAFLIILELLERLETKMLIMSAVYWVDLCSEFCCSELLLPRDDCVCDLAEPGRADEQAGLPWADLRT